MLGIYCEVYTYIAISEMKSTSEGVSMILWILACKMNDEWDILYAFYAKDEDDAERQARHIAREQGYERLSLKAYPYGFVIHKERLGGTLEEQGRS